MNVVVITGGSRGIGAATARECSRRGMGVILTYNTQSDRADQIAREIRQVGGLAAVLKLDVTDMGSFDEFRSAVEQTLSSIWNVEKIGGLVNNAGYGSFNPIETLTEAEFDGLMRVHLKGPLFLTQALLPLMKSGASIVNVSSATTRVATVGVAPYAALKGGLEILSRYMAKEFGDRRIRVNAVAPGAIRTELAGGLSDEFEALLSSQTALGRIGEPEEVARVIATLLTDSHGWINAQTIEITGGYQI